MNVDLQTGHGSRAAGGSLCAEVLELARILAPPLPLGVPPKTALLERVRASAVAAVEAVVEIVARAHLLNRDRLHEAGKAAVDERLAPGSPRDVVGVLRLAGLEELALLVDDGRIR